MYKLHRKWCSYHEGKTPRYTPFTLIIFLILDRFYSANDKGLHSTQEIGKNLGAFTKFHEFTNS